MGRHKRVVDMGANIDTAAERADFFVTIDRSKHFGDRRVYFAAKKLVRHYLNPFTAGETDWTKSEDMKKLVDAVTDHPEWGKK